MTDEERALLAVLMEEREAGALVAQLVSEGWTVDQALGLVAFPEITVTPSWEND